MTPLEITHHQARAERLARFKDAADALMQRQVKRLTEGFDARDAIATLNAERIEKLKKSYPKCPPPRRNMICREVRHKHGFTWEEMISESHGPKLCSARYEAWWRLRAETTMSYPQIGELFNRDHSTIIHGIRTWQERQGAQQ